MISNNGINKDLLNGLSDYKDRTSSQIDIGDLVINDYLIQDRYINKLYPKAKLELFQDFKPWVGIVVSN